MGVRLNTKGRYAVMAVVDLAMRGDQKPVPLSDIAERQNISLSYLEQMFSRLRRSKLVRSVRGPGGGYLLARQPDQIRIADVFVAVDDTAREKKCSPAMPNICSNRSARCATHDLWAELGNETFRYLNSVTVADVVAGDPVTQQTRPDALAAE